MPSSSEQSEVARPPSLRDSTLLIGFVVVAASMVVMFTVPSHDFLAAAYGSTACMAVAGYILSGRASGYSRLFRPRPWTIVLGLSSAVLLYLVFYAGNLGIAAIHPFGISASNEGSIYSLISSPGNPAYLQVGVLAFDSVGYESFFRGVLQRERRFVDATEPPQIVVMPFRYEIYSTTVEELFDSLARMLEEMVVDEREESTVSSSLLEGSPPPNPEEYLITILSNLQAFKGILRERIGGLGKIKLSDLIREMSQIEAARTFILLLFSASSGEVILEQEGENDVLVVLVG